MSLAKKWASFFRRSEFQVLEQYFYYLTAQELQEMGLDEFMEDVDEAHKGKMLDFFETPGVRAFIDHIDKSYMSAPINYVLITDNVIRFPSGTNLKLTYDDVKFVSTKGRPSSASYPRIIIVGLEFHDGHVAKLVEMVKNLQPIFWRDFQPWISLEKTQMSLNRYDTAQPPGSPDYFPLWADLVQLLRRATVSIRGCNYVMRESFLYYLYTEGVLDKLEWLNLQDDHGQLSQELERNYPPETVRAMEKAILKAHQ